jgi:ElaB/YqjD/DUF883 family membrane-anchored ribosome-binding protein
MNDHSSPLIQDRQVLIRDVRKLVDDTQALLSRSAAEAGQELAKTREQAAAHLREAQLRLEGLQARTQLKVREWAHQGDVYVHRNPWKTVGAAAACATGLGLVLGLLLSRR